MKLIIARPSPYARKVRIALLEKCIPFETIVENPWLPRTEVPAANPLGKVPALVLDDGKVVHDSKVIVEYLETLGAPPTLIPQSPGLRVEHKQIEVVADGICDAVVLIALEGARPEAMRSADWIARQHRKIVAGVAELSHLLGERQTFTDFGFGLAEIAAGCALGYLDFRYPNYDWRAQAPNLDRLYRRLSERPSFAQTQPAPQELPTIR
ncbi:MAG TPA: glutathione S-transferase N-terminal domain-containing protein [Burkholderiales bacterium]|nr:glutathione S-transferase N-terminal domain-containing protein [Burkholderiales bacterium]